MKNTFNKFKYLTLCCVAAFAVVQLDPTIANNTLLVVFFTVGVFTLLLSILVDLAPR